MKIETLSLAEIVTAKPAAAAILENYNLDFCCGGKRKLSEVLINDQLQLTEVVGKLEQLFGKESSPEIDFNNFSLTQLTDHIIENHHSYVKENLPVIQQHLEELKMFELDLHQHVHLENNILFPKAVELERNFIQSSSSCLI